MMDRVQAEADSMRSLARTLRKLAENPVNRDRRQKLRTDADWYDARAKDREDMPMEEANE